MFERGIRWLMADGAPHHLALLRVLVGCYALGWLLVTTPELLRIADLDPARFEPVGVVAFTGMGPLPRALIAGIVLVALISGVSSVTGRAYRVSALVFATTVLWLATYQNSWGKLLHTENLLAVHLAVLAVSPAADALARGRPRRGAAGPSYGWAVRVMAIATVLAYLAAAVTKLRTAGLDWVDADNLRNWVAYDLVRKDLFGDPYLPVAPWALAHPWVFGPAAVFTLVVELSAPLALVMRRFRPVWVASVWSLHLGVLVVMSVAFPYQLAGVALAPVLLCSTPRARSRVAAGHGCTDPARIVQEPTG